MNKENYHKVNLQPYRLKLLDYCNTYLSPSVRTHGKRAGKMFFSPFSDDHGPRGHFSLYDPSNPSNGTALTMWKDWKSPTQESGDIFDLIQKQEGLDFAGALKRCQELYGPELGAMEETVQQKRNAGFIQMKRGRKTPEQIEKEKVVMAKQEQLIEDKIKKNIEQTGTFFGQKTLQMPFVFYPNGKPYPLKGTNYLIGMLQGNDDPRYMTETEIRKSGYKVKEGAKAVIFEWIVHKENPPQPRPWRMYNAKDIAGIPKYIPPKLSQEELRERLDHIIAYGNKASDSVIPENMFERPEEALRDSLGKLTFQAEVKGQFLLERELTVDYVMRRIGYTTSPEIDKKEIVLRHLDRDIAKNDHANLFKSLIGMDNVAEKVLGGYSREKIKEICQQQQEREKMIQKPFSGLKIKVLDVVYLEDGKTLPKGAEIAGERCYKTMAAIIKRDKELFMQKKGLDYGKRLPIEVHIQDNKLDAAMTMGALSEGNKITVSGSMKEILMQPERRKLYDEDLREETISDRINLKAFQSEEYKKRAINDMAACRAEELEIMKQEYRQAEAAVDTALAPLIQEEEVYLSNHPEIHKDIKIKADTYLYRVENTDEETLWNHYGPDIMIAQRTPDYYGSKELGYVIETRTPFVAGIEEGNTYFYAPGKSDMKAEAFLTGIERSRQAHFDENFAVTVNDGKSIETYAGEEGRMVLAYTMLDDREMYESEKTGMKKRDAAQPSEITVTYEGKTLMQGTIYPGQMRLGNHQSVPAALQTASGKLLDDTLVRELQGSAKYTQYNEVDHLIENYNVKSQKEIDSILEQTFEPQDYQQFAPRPGRTTENMMKYYEAKAEVNFHCAPQDKADYIVDTLSQLYTAKTVQGKFDKGLPALKDLAAKSLERPEVQERIKQRKSSKSRHTGLKR